MRKVTFEQDAALLRQDTNFLKPYDVLGIAASIKDLKWAWN